MIVHETADGHECPLCLSPLFTVESSGDIHTDVTVRCVNCALTGVITKVATKPEVEWGK